MKVTLKKVRIVDFASRFKKGEEGDIIVIEPSHPVDSVIMRNGKWRRTKTSEHIIAIMRLADEEEFRSKQKHKSKAQKPIADGF